MNRICPVCEQPLKNDDEQVCRKVLGNMIWIHYGKCGDEWDRAPDQPNRSGKKQAA